MGYGNTFNGGAWEGGASGGRRRKYLLLAIVIVLLIVGGILIGLFLSDMFGSNPSIGGISGFKSSEDIIRDYISRFYPSVRDRAISILNSYVDRCGIVLSESLRIGAGSWTRVEFHA